MSRLRAFALPMLLVVAAAPAAVAALPAVSYLHADRFRVPLGETTVLRCYAADGQPAAAGVPAVWPAEQMKWYFVRGGPNQENRDRVQPAATGQPGADYVNVEVKHPGVTMVGIDLQPQLREMAQADWQALLNARMTADSEGRGERASVVKVRMVESFKTLLRASLANGEARSSSIAMSKAGLAAEVMPLMDPTLTAGNDLAVRVFTDGIAREGALVRATHLTTQQSVTFATDKVGSGHFRVSAPGEWRVEFHHVTRGRDGADWTVYSGTLTFEATGSVAAVPAEGVGQ